MDYTDLFNKDQFKRFKDEIEHYNDYEFYNQSTLILKNSIICFPSHPGLYYLLSVTYFNCKEYLKATENFKIGISYESEKNGYLGLISCCFLCINDLENSYNYACKAYEIDKYDLDAIITLGKIELIRNNYEESLSYAVIAIEINNESFSAIRLLSKIYISMGVDEKDTLGILYRARKFGCDEDLTLDIIKLLYLNEEYILCLNECKNTIINHETGYVVEKATRFVNYIYKRFVTFQSSVESLNEIAVEVLSDENNIKSEIRDALNKDKKTNFRDITIENINKVINQIKNNGLNSSDNEIKDYSKEQNNIKAEIKSNIKDDNKKQDLTKKSNSKDESLKRKRSSFKKNNENIEIDRDSSSLEEALEKLNSLTGLSNVKNEIKKIVQLIKYEKNRGQVLGIEKDLVKSYHFSFLGNPGTGKTTVARLIGDIFYYLGILEKGQLVEVDRSDIVGRFIGETAKLTKKAIDKAMDGILFIDEAYSLAKGGADSNDYGKESIEILLKAMEDSRGKFTVILAGYTKEMRNLLKLNPGLKSRLNLEIEFEDYSENELCHIAKNMASKDKYKISKDGEKAFLEKINVEKIDENFANARCVRNILEEAIRQKAFRIGNNYVTKDELITLTSEDFGVNLEFIARDNVKELKKELDNLVGLEEVKDIVIGILNTLEFQHRKKNLGIACNDICLNMIFSGNPGSGKTTVARIIGKILKAMGILKKGQMVEVTRSDLVGQYVGQTALKTLRKIKEAYGGILFIDEAYSLNGRNQNDFGKEAIATLIKEMEDNRDKLIVIMAGYTNEMKELIDLNPGFESRVKFNVEFKDYNENELLQIFKILCKKEKYTISHNAHKKLNEVFKEMVSNKDENFGNARLVRKYFEDVKMKQATRIINENVVEKKELLKIILEDVD